MFLILLISSVHASVGNLKGENLGREQASALEIGNEYDGYIIELREKPLIAKKIVLDNQKEETKDKATRYLKNSETGFFLINYYERWRGGNLAEKYMELEENAPKELVEQNEKILAEHRTAIEEIKRVLNREVKLEVNKEGREFGLGFNGFVLDISELEAEKIKKLDVVKEVYPNYKVHTLLNESVPAMEIDLARNYRGLTGEGVVIAVIDTGIDASHESLDDLDDDDSTNDPKVIGWKDYINFRISPYDDHGHGTHVAGIAAGTGGGSEFIGVAPKAKLVGVKVLDDWGSGTFSTVIAGIEWTIQNKDVYNISIISMSLGANVNSDGTTPVEIAADYAVASGINFAVAAGNAGPSSNTVGIPASALDVITVGAVDKNLDIASFSSRGPTRDGRIKPEVSAVGVDVISSVPRGDCWLCSPEGYMGLSGTSMATPHVSGFIALLLEQSPSLTTAEVKDLVMNTAVDKGENGPDNTYGYGVLNGLKTLFNINPPEHEVAVSKVNWPSYLELNQISTIEAEIENLGLNDENIEVIFSVDGVEENRKQVSISSKSKKVIDFEYTPDLEKEYYMKIEIAPITSEVLSANNEKTKLIKAIAIAGEIKAVVLDSWGADKAEYTIFDEMNENWMLYGDYAVTIDYKTLNKEDITYEDIVDSNADVLIISNAWTNQHFGFQFEFKDSEIQAIKQYVNEGHGLIGTSGTLSEYSPNNIKLAELFGIKEKIGLWSRDSGSYYPMNILVSDAILTKNLPDEYSLGYGAAIINLELDETKPVVTVAKILERGDLWKNIFVSAYKPERGASIYFTPIIEIVYANEIDKQFFYNALVWTSENIGQLTEDIAVSNLQAPEKVSLNGIASVSAKVKNNGLNQKDVNVEFKINDVAEQTQILTLSAGEEREVSFSKQFNQLGEFRISVNAVPSEEENYVINNKVVSNILVPALILTGNNQDYGLDLDGDGLYEYIVLELGVEVFEEGLYYTNFDFESFLGTSLLDDVYEDGELNITNNKISLKIPVKEIIKMDLNGPYKIKNFLLSFNGVEVEKKDELMTTKPYKVSEFERGTGFTGKFRDYGLDLDGNGKYDWLVIDTEVQIKEEGDYEVRGELFYEYYYITWAANISHLTKGVHNISLLFSGKYIRESERDGPYNLRYLSLYGYDTDEWDYIYDAYITSPYSWSSFESGACTDYDGFDVTTASYATEEGGKYYDECMNSNTVKEYYCELDIWQMKRLVKSMSKECKYECGNGACIGESDIPPCYDTDPENNLYYKGEVTYNETVYLDKCEELGKSVREYFCYQGKIKTFVKRCPEGSICQDGICLGGGGETGSGGGGGGGGSS